MVHTDLIVMTSWPMSFSMVVIHSTFEFDDINRKREKLSDPSKPSSASQNLINISFLLTISILATSFWTAACYGTGGQQLIFHSPIPAISIFWPFNILEKQLINLKQTNILTTQAVNYILAQAVLTCLRRSVKPIKRFFKYKELVWKKNDCLVKSTINTLYDYGKGAENHR